MKIECTLRRPSGTKVQFDNDDGTVEYHFKADAEGKHIADVADVEHATKLLTISEAYAPADAESAKIAAIVSKKPEADFADPSVTGKVYDEASLNAMKYKEIKKLAQEKYGIELGADAKVTDYAIAILNAQGG